MAKVYQLPLDEVMDQDIISRMDNIPRARKAEWVRTAIRVYMSMEKGDNVPVVAPAVPSNNKQTNDKKRPKDISFE